MKRLTLHIGTHKTGTTSLQSLLAENNEALNAQGICFPEMKKYPKAGLNRNGRFLFELASEQLDGQCDPPELHERNQKNYKAFTACMKQFDHVILSDEGLWFHGARRPELWGTMKQLAQQAGAERIDIVVYFRRQDQFAFSHWNQRVKSAVLMRASLKTFTDTYEVKCALDYSKGLEELERQFGKDHITVRVFEPQALDEGDVRIDFCHVMGIDYSDFTMKSNYSNISLSLNMCEVKRQANRVESYRATDNFLRYAAARTTQLAGKPKKPQSGYSEAQLKKMAKRYAPGNARIAREYLGREDGTLFKPVNPETEKWSMETTAFTQDAIRFFVDAIATEHTKRLEAEKALADLTKRVENLEKQLNER